MATANVVTTQTGTGFTIDVTACNLDTDITIKDFYVLHAGTLFCDGQTDGCSAYTKVTAASITYGGTALGANTTVEVRRKTPRSVIQTILYANRFTSALWNNEFTRITRRAEEYDLNSVGAGSQQTVATPNNGAYPTGWSTDVVTPPTRQAAFNIISTLAPIASPTFTGVPLSTTPATADSTTKIATTNYVQNNLVSFAPLASPALSGVPTAPTPTQGDNTTKLATTAFVTTLTRPNFRINRNTATGNFTTTQTVIFNGSDYDSDNIMNAGAGTATIPAGAGGLYCFDCTVICQNASGVSMSMQINLFVNGSLRQLIDFQNNIPSGAALCLSGVAMTRLSAADVVTLSITPGTANNWNYGNATIQHTVFAGFRVSA